MSHTDPSPERRDDPTLVHARREFRVVLCVVGVVILWAIGVCALDGYRSGTTEFVTWLGMPRWAVLGILGPWLCLIAFNYWFGLFFVVDDDLSRDDYDAASEPVPIETPGREVSNS